MDEELNKEIGLPITKEEVSVVKDILSLTGGNVLLTGLIIGFVFYMKQVKKGGNNDALKCELERANLKDKQNQMELKIKDQQMVLNDVLNRVEDLEDKKD